MVAALLSMALVLAACGGDDDDDAATATTGSNSKSATTQAGADGNDGGSGDGSGKLADCPLTVADVSGVMGAEMVAADEPCGFDTAADPVGGPKVYYRPQSKNAVEAFGPAGGGENVDGLGDAASWDGDGGDADGSVVVQTGDETFEIQMIFDKDGRAHATELARIVLGS
jgi:hypothetical protein